MTARKAIPARQAREVVEFLEQALGRPVDSAEVATELQRVWRTAKAATTNADKARRSAQTRSVAEGAAEARRLVASQLGRLDLLQSIHRSERPEWAGIGDATVHLRRLDGSPVTPGNRHREVFTRAAVSVADGVQPEPFDWSTMTGVVGTPFTGGTPAVELNADLYPYQGRGLSYDQGQFMAAYRSDSVIREGVANLVSVIAGATIEVQAPNLTERQAELLGVDRDQLDAIADELNADLQFGLVDFRDAFEQMLRSGIINGFGLYEFAMDPDAAPGRRIIGLSPRLPNTVMRWVFDPLSGELVGVQQTNPNGNVYKSGLAPFLDIRKCALFSVDRDGDNVEGLSLIRSARQWDLLSMEVTSASILHWQRFGPGVPVLRRTNDAPNSAAASDAAFRALSQYANLSDAVLELGSGVDVELLQMQMSTGLEGIIDMCAKYKRSAIRDAVSGLGTESAGAYNLGDVKSQLWLKGLGVFARQIERAWQNMIRVYCDLYHPGLVLYPTLRVTGFATRSPSEVLTLQQSFATLAQSGQFTDRELVEIAEKAEIIWHGRGTEGDMSDDQTAPVEDGAPVDGVALATEDAAGGGLNTSEDAMAETVGAPYEDQAGDPAPPEARKASAIGLRRKRNAAPEERWSPSIADAALVKRIASGQPLSELDLRFIDAYFDGAADVKASPEWATQGPAWQEWHAFGGDAMAAYVNSALAPELPEAEPEPEPDDLPDDPPTPKETVSPASAQAWLSAVRAGMTFGDAADSLELSLSAIRQYRNDNPAFEAEVEKARGASMPDDPPTTRNTQTRAPEKYAHIDFTPPKGVREAARRGLEVRASKPPSQRGGTEVGVARARDLANGRTVSPDTARRMKAYFDRHEVDKEGETWDEQGKGWQAWQLWGGDPGRSWADKLVRQMNAADEKSTPRTIPGFGRRAAECDCGECAPTTRAKRPLFAVATRTGEFMTWRELTPVEQAVSFDGIAGEKTAAVDRMTRAIEAEQRAHRTAYANAAEPLIATGNVAGLARLSVDFTERYRLAMLPALRSLSEFASTDMLSEIAAQVGSRTWTATSDTVIGSAAQVEAAAALAAQAVNDRVNEQLRGASVQVVNGARPSVLTAAPMSIGNTAGGLLEQTASTTVNESRAVTAAEQGPRIVRAVYSAVMDRYTCDVCADADGTEVEYGSDRYRRLSPPNPRCKSVTNSGGLRNLCQCVWVYEYEGPTTGPGPINPTRTGGLQVRGASRTASASPVQVSLVCGPPGSGKSTLARSEAATTDGVVIDRDDFVLVDGEYNPSGRSESLEALTAAVQSAPAGGSVYFVACMLTPEARASVADHILATADRDIAVHLIPVAADRPRLHEVNAARAETDRGMIPADQLEHLIDAWTPPTTEELLAYGPAYMAQG